MRIIRGTAVIPLMVCTAVLLAACGADSGGSPQSPQSPLSPAESPSTGTTSPAAAPTPSASPGSTRSTPGNGETPAAASVSLTVEFKADGTTTSSTWTLMCDGAVPRPGSDIPDPAGACALLAEQGAAALAEPAPNQICKQQISGMQRAHVTGTVNDTSVDTTFSLRDGCQTSRWERLTALLGPAANVL